MFATVCEKNETRLRQLKPSFIHSDSTLRSTFPNKIMSVLQSGETTDPFYIPSYLRNYSEETIFNTLLCNESLSVSELVPLYDIRTSTLQKTGENLGLVYIPAKFSSMDLPITQKYMIIPGLTNNVADPSNVSDTLVFHQKIDTQSTDNFFRQCKTSAG